MNPKAMKGNLSPPAIALIGELYILLSDPLIKIKQHFALFN